MQNLVMVDGADLESAIGELEKFAQGVPFAAARAMNPKRWSEVASRRANEILTMLAETAEEHGLVAKLVKSVTAGFWEDATVWEMAAPAETVDLDAATKDWQNPATHTELFQRANRDQVNALYREVLDWVRTTKRRDDRDRGKSDQDIAYGLVTILLGGSEERNAARKKILPHIQKFLDEKMRAQIGEEKLGMWLNAVLDGWGALALEECAAAIDEELVEEWGKRVKGKLELM